MIKWLGKSANLLTVIAFVWFLIVVAHAIGLYQ